jgi:hypothetical protein
LPGERAGVAAAQGDDDVGGADDFIGPWLWELVGDVDPAFGHGGDRGRVHLDAQPSLKRTPSCYGIAPARH